MTASAATSRAASSRRPFLPAVILHGEARPGIELLFLEHKSLALIPAPGAFVLAHAAQPDLIRQLVAREAEQTLAEPVALILGRDEQLIEVGVAQSKGQHGRDRAVVVGHIEAPAVLDLAGNARAHHPRQRGAVGSPDAVRQPASRPDIGNRVVFVGPREADRGDAHRLVLCMTAMWSSDEAFLRARS